MNFLGTPIDMSKQNAHKRIHNERRGEERETESIQINCGTMLESNAMLFIPKGRIRAVKFCQCENALHQLS
jgi:hypothetical protein